MLSTSRVASLFGHVIRIQYGLALLSLSVTALAGMTEDYSRAERFLYWNKDKYIFNEVIEHHWMDGDRFWYSKINAAGTREFIVVDAASGAQWPAFDRERVAASLSKAMQRDVLDSQLPFSTFRFTHGENAILFEAGGSFWTCWLDTAACAKGDPSNSSPDESVSSDGSWAVHIKDHNLWVRHIGNNTEFPLTADGEMFHDYANYHVDKVTYERAGGKAAPDILWSPDSHSFLTYRVDERDVKDYALIQASPDNGDVRPKLYRFKYPIAGDNNTATASLVIFDVAKRQQLALHTEPLNVEQASPIQSRYTWWSQDGSKIYFMSRDRYSRVLSLNVADIRTGQVRGIISEESSTAMSDPDGGVWGPPAVRSLKNGDIIWYSTRDGWGHLYYYTTQGELRNQITRGTWNVRGIQHVDEKHRRIYFLGSGRETGRDPYEQHLYAIGFDGSGMRLLTPEDANHELNSKRSGSAAASITGADRQLAGVSPSGHYFIDSFSRPDSPPVFVVRTTDGRLVKRLERANISRLQVDGYKPIETFQTVADDGRTAIYGNLFRPSTFDPQRKYPVIDSDYPGPQAIRVQKSFSDALFDWFEPQSLAELGFIVVTIDGRGTPLRSKAFLDFSYGRLDKASYLKDHIAGIQQLARRYSYMDLDRVGIWGVSAGGYASARAILAYPDFFKVAVAAEGGQDQRSNAASWVETHIGPLATNTSNYDLSSNLPLAMNLKGKLLLMEGELDDRCPPYLTTRLADALIRANKDFDLIVMPNLNHHAYLSPYFIRRKWNYFVLNLLHQQPPSSYTIHPPTP